MEFNLREAFWTRQPREFSLDNKRIEIVTEPHTDLWQKTYYQFSNDSAPLLQLLTEEQFFSFKVKTEFHGTHRFDQCGIVVYIDSDSWAKASVEYENEDFQHLGSVVTNNGYSDWATTTVPADVHEMWYRLSRRGGDFRFEASRDGEDFQQIRMFHLTGAARAVPFGIYACSPENGSFRAIFSHLEVTDCVWEPYGGQQTDLA